MPLSVTDLLMTDLFAAESRFIECRGFRLHYRMMGSGEEPFMLFSAWELPQYALMAFCCGAAVGNGDGCGA